MIVTAAESERKERRGGQCEYGGAGKGPEGRRGRLRKRPVRFHGGLTWNIRRVGGRGQGLYSDGGSEDLEGEAEWESQAV